MTTAKVRAAPVSASYGKATTVVATVTGAEPTGNVTFNEGGIVLGTAKVANGTAKLALGATRLKAGKHSLQVTYNRDGANTAATGSVQVTIANAGTNVEAVVKPKKTEERQSAQGGRDAQGRRRWSPGGKVQIKPGCTDVNLLPRL